MKRNHKLENETKKIENIERYSPEIEQGLSEEQVCQRKKQGLINYDTAIPTKSIPRIILENVVTLFNIMNFLLAFVVFCVGSYKNMLFLGIILCNILISTIQEIHSKRIVDKLSIIASKKVTCKRSGKTQEIEMNEIVLDDILILKTGNQVITDVVVEQGEVEIDASFITGEPNIIRKKKGEEILSGSIIISGTCFAKVEHVGIDNYTYKISSGAKYVKKVRSEIMSSLNKIIRIVSIVIVPVGTLLFLNQCNIVGNDLKHAVVNSVAAIIGMIPEGLILLTSTVLAVSVIRLSRRKVLVQELYCIETLARVDTLCLDKTGTITEGKMEVKKILPIQYKQEEIDIALNMLARSMQDENPTIDAIREYSKEMKNVEEKWKTTQIVPFSSIKKWSGASFKEKGSYVIGAPEFVLKEEIQKYQKEIEKEVEMGRVLVVAKSKQEFRESKQGDTQVTELPKQLEVMGFLVISDKIRKDARQTLSYFKEQGVTIKIISGDNPITVAKVAKQAGVENCEKYIDMSTIEKKDSIEEIVENYTIFGRVSPIQKKEIMDALKRKGHTVAMTGDGVNDVLALKEADCSIAMASGTDAARNVSQLVLLESDFKSMPAIVAEGRRTINNIERSASLFLVKTIYSCILAILFVFIRMPYPFMPIQLSLIALVTIGIPSFVLALEPNKERIKGHFLRNVITKSIPTALTTVTNILIIAFISSACNLSVEAYASICVVLTVVTGFGLLLKLCNPITPTRLTLFIGMVTLFVVCITLFRGWFSILLTPEVIGLCLILAIIAITNNLLLSKFFRYITKVEAY